MIVHHQQEGGKLIIVPCLININLTFKKKLFRRNMKDNDYITQITQQ